MSSSITVTNTGLIIHTDTGDLTVNIPNFSGLGIDPNSDSYHVYNNPQIVGSSDPHSSEYISNEDIIWTNLQEEPFPTFGFSTTDVPIANGTISHVTGLGDVVSYVYDNSQIIVNVTQPDHMLSPGVVVRYLYEQPDGSYVIESIGIGNGWNPLNLNNLLSESVWQLNVDRISRESIYEDNLPSIAPTPSTTDNSLLDFDTDFFDDAVDNDYDLEDLLWEEGGVFGDGTYSATMASNILNSDGYFNVTPSFIVSDGWRPGAQETSTYSMFNDFSSIYTPFIDTLDAALASFNNYISEALTSLNIDPLILDLDGDGIELVDFTQSGVLFDIDNDGYREQTGWVGVDDGILVHDKNANGTIDDITETLSEYYTTGVADGIAALATLDANHDNVINSADAAYSFLKVWQDSDGDGETDAGELKSLSALGITSISLNKTSGNGEIVEGNEILAHSTMVKSGQTRAIAAVDFISNPAGHEWTLEQFGMNLQSESGTTSYVINDANGATISTSLEQVQNIYGNIGNDRLIGDSGSNWLAGGGGSDTFIGGAGNDMLVIDADDLQANIDGGSGFDVVQVTGDHGVAFNLSEAHVEVAMGGRGNDLLIGGGMANTFISGGAGHDIIIGGAADDALSGEDGDDLVDGSYGDDILRGHRGEDMLIGGEGEDYLDGGLDDDILKGGVGNDLLIGGAGNDQIDGGDGYDIAEFSGSFSDYNVTYTASGITVTDRVAGRDGADILTGIEGFSFSDIKNVSTSQQNPIAVDDIITISGTGPYTITAAQLLGNDIDYQGNSLSLRTIVTAIGGTAVINANGNVIFTPAANFDGVAYFKYTVQDSQGNIGISVKDSGSGNIQERNGTVFLRTPEHPSDPSFYEQWYLSKINVLSVWKDYTGEGIKVGVFETGIMDFNNSDLAPNMSSDFLATANASDIHTHATLVSGIIGAARNGEGIVGVAYESTLASQAITDDDFTNLQRYKEYDVVNNSWGFIENFTQTNVFYKMWMREAITQGRSSLGTSIVFSAGNDRDIGGNTNYSVFTNSRYAITVGSVNNDSDTGSLQVSSQPFSNPGASILVSAPGSNIESVSRIQTNDNGTTFGSDLDDVNGTSFSAPIVSGVIALMLEANPNLGYRDVQKILAYSATNISDSNTNWVINGAKDWNGGGLHTSNDYGFGMVDAHAAVRLAESWSEINTAANENQVGATKQNPIAITDNGTVTDSININSAINIEHVEVLIDITHENIGDIIIKLVSPLGTETMLLNRPGKAPGSGAEDTGTGAMHLIFPLTSTQFYGEEAAGTWTLKVTDSSGTKVGTLNNWSLNIYGKDDNGNDTYVYTDEYANYANTARSSLADAGGYDTINATAVTSNTTINLNAGSTSSIAGRNLTITANSIIENAYSGDGNDILTGNSAANTLNGGRGNDTISGGAGDDIINGGKANDVLSGGTGSDTFVVVQDPGSTDTITDFEASNFKDSIDVSAFGLSSFSSLSITQNGINTIVSFSNGQTLVLQNVTASSISSGHFKGIGAQGQTLNGTSGKDNLYGTEGNDTINGYDGDDFISGRQGNNTLTGSAGADKYFIANNPGHIDIITDFSITDIEEKIILTDLHSITSFSNLLITQNGNDTIITLGGGQTLKLQNVSSSQLTANNFIFFNSLYGDDILRGGQGADVLFGGNQDDLLFGNEGDDTLYGGSGNDILIGGSSKTEADDILNSGNDILFGDAGNDEFYGGDGNDILDGGDGDDAINGGKGDDRIYGQGGSDGMAGGDGNDIMDGGDGNDTFSGNNGNDIITGGNGDDTIDGHGDNDTLLGGAGNDTLNGGVGNDFIKGENENDIIYGGEGDDHLLGGNGDDNINGAIGNDVVDGGKGANNLWGGTGYDQFIISEDYGNYDVIWDFDSTGWHTNSQGVDVWNETINLQDFQHLRSVSDLTFYSGTFNGATSTFIFLGKPGNTPVSVNISNPVTPDLKEIILYGVSINTVKISQFNFYQNTAPIANNDSAVTTENTPSVINVLGNDDSANHWLTVDNITNISNPTHGTASANLDGTITYTPSANFSGTDSFTYTIRDTDGLAGSATVSVQVNPLSGTAANIAPVVAGTVQSQTATANQAFNFTIPASLFFDANGDVLTYSVTLADGSPIPAWLTFNNNTRVLSGTPGKNDVGDLTIKVTANDGHASASSNFILNIEGYLSATNTTQSIGYTEDNSRNMQPVVINSSSSLVTAILVLSSPTAGTINTGTFGNITSHFANGIWSASGSVEDVNGLLSNLTFTPTENYHSNFTIDVVIDGGSALPIVGGSIAMGGQSVNDAPTASSVTITTVKNIPYIVSSTNLLTQSGAADVDGDTLTISSVQGATNGSVVLSGGNITFTPNANYFGAASFTYTVNDGKSGAVTKTANLTINPVNDAPVVGTVIPTQSGVAGNSFSYVVPANAFTDVDSSLSYTAKQSSGSALPSWLVFNAVTRTFTGTPPSGAATSLTVIVTASDGTLSASQNFILSIANNIINGTSGNDTIIGTAASEDIRAGSGNDIITGGLGADLIDGGKGTDTVSYADSSEGVVVSLVAGEVNTGGTATGDVLKAIENLTGSAFNDQLTGSSVANTLSGGAGDDIINGAGGADVLDGGAGIDVASYTGSGSAVTVSLVAGASNTGGFAAGDVLTGFENLIGSSYADTLTGNAGNNVFKGGLGADKINGGAGTDTADYSDSSTAVGVSLATGATNTGGTAAGDVLTSIENLLGSSYNDTLIGDANANALYGNTGNDALYGGGGSDALYGGIGADSLTGGAGNDSFNFTSLTDSKTGVYDTIQDFVRGQDKIFLALSADGIDSFSDLSISYSATETIITAPTATDTLEIHLKGVIPVQDSDFVWG